MARKQLTITDIAQELGIARETLGYKLSRKRSINLDEALKISKKFFPECDLYYLFKELLPDNAPERGFCLGRFYCDDIPGLNKKVIRRRMEKNKDDSYLEYDIHSGNMNLVNAKANVTIDAKGKVIIQQAAAVEITTVGNVMINCAALNVTGQTSITGNFNVNGSIHASGSIIDGGGNTNHHGH